MPRDQESIMKGKRASIRRKVTRLEREMREAIDEHYQKPVEEWDWEELSRGAPRNEDNKFRGPRPVWVTPAVLAEAKRRMRQLTEEELMIHAMQAISVLSELMSNRETDDWGKPVVSAAVKLQAAQYVINHVIGTPKARHEIETSNPLSELMSGILVNPDGEPSHMIIEGEVADGEEESE
jgi:hypothetical protein